MTGALLGLLAPPMVFAVSYLFDLGGPDKGGDWLIWFWPSMLGLIALERVQSSIGAGLVISVSVGLNVILYAGIAWSGAFIYSRVVKSR